MKKTCLLFCSALLLGLASCDYVDGGAFQTRYTSYVYSYHFPNEISLEVGEFGYGAYPFDSCTNTPYGFYVLFHEDDTSQVVGQWQKKGERELFDALSVKHKDTKFNQYVTSSSAKPYKPHNYLGFDFVSITVTSNADFDTQHPAGTPLNDLVQFIAYTPYPFILSGYKYSASKGDKWDLLKQETTLIDKPLSACTSEDFILTLGCLDNWLYQIFPSCYLHIKATPTIAQQHTITVTILDNTGKTWQASVDMDWNK